jgi:hypothetical protein
VSGIGLGIAYNKLEKKCAFTDVSILALTETRIHRGKAAKFSYKNCIRC